jgi:hypothetical protein
MSRPHGLAPILLIGRSFNFRYQGRLQAICFPFLRLRDLGDGQRARDPGDRPPLRGSLRSILWKRESSLAHTVEKLNPISPSQVCELDL